MRGCVFGLIGLAAAGRIYDPELPCLEECRRQLPAVGAMGDKLITAVWNAVLGTLYSSPANDAKTFAHCRANSLRCHTMLSPYVLQNLRAAVQSVIAHSIPGDVVELGVWRGGGAMLVKALLDAYGEGRRRDVHLFDVFDTVRDMYVYQRDAFGTHRENSISAISGAFRKLGLLDEHVHFHEGYFNTTTAAFRRRARHGSSAGAARETQIAVLRIDGNFYTSYEDAMYNLYSFVPVGGIVIFDDYFDNKAIQLFWRHFQHDHGVRENVTNAMGSGPGGCGWFRKTQQVGVDRRKMRRVASKEGR